MLRNLDARFHADPAPRDRERSAIFRAHWHLLGPAARVAG